MAIDLAGPRELAPGGTMDLRAAKAGRADYRGSEPAVRPLADRRGFSAPAFP